MIQLKSPREIEIMAEGGRILADTIAMLRERVRPGMTTLELDRMAEDFIRSHPGATPSFKGLYGFPGTLCTSINEEIVRRLSARTLCDTCQTPYTGREPGERCEKCGGTLVRRKDDEPDAIRQRLAVYERQTAPVIGWYERRGARVKRIDAAGTPDEVFERIVAALGEGAGAPAQRVGGSA